MSKISPLKPRDGRQKPRPGPEEQTRIIVDAAVALFLEQGVRSVSIMQICHQADVSRSTFYRCFEGIDSLLQYIYSVSVFEPVEQFMKTGFSNTHLEAGELQQAMDDMFDAIFEQATYAELLFRESNDPNSPAFEVVNEAFDSIVKAMQTLLPGTGNKKVDVVYLKSILNANQWIAHDTIRKGITPANTRAAKQAAWQLVQKGLDL